ncbi:MAG: hypothetical protein JOZ41_21880 [Chloroflexi bacterium]|nr:hypothetical protein [Chloroflexota bacterium]
MSPSPSVVIRPATGDDALAVSAIQLESLRALYAGIIPEETFAAFAPFTKLEGWQQLLRQPDETAHLFVAQEPGGQVVGYARCGENIDEDELTYPGEINAFHVLDYQAHTPAALALLEAILSHLASEGLLPAVAITPSTSPLRAIFEQLGGHVIGREDVFVQGTAHHRLRYAFGEGVDRS